mmetsp:Transcript_18036/g.49103  ORF Transcript_18036/g.49103 Transcript_18036/m.49103 type:complete len:226 (+) Transcript_18036:950-1627(+)
MIAAEAAAAPRNPKEVARPPASTSACALAFAAAASFAAISAWICSRRAAVLDSVSRPATKAKRGAAIKGAAPTATPAAGGTPPSLILDATGVTLGVGLGAGGATTAFGAGGATTAFGAGGALAALGAGAGFSALGAGAGLEEGAGFSALGAGAGLAGFPFFSGAAVVGGANNFASKSSSALRPTAGRTKGEWGTTNADAADAPSATKRAVLLNFIVSDQRFLIGR